MKYEQQCFNKMNCSLKILKGAIIAKDCRILFYFAICCKNMPAKRLLYTYITGTILTLGNNILYNLIDSY